MIAALIEDAIRILSLAPRDVRLSLERRLAPTLADDADGLAVDLAVATNRADGWRSRCEVAEERERALRGNLDDMTASRDGWQRAYDAGEQRTSTAMGERDEARRQTETWVAVAKARLDDADAAKRDLEALRETMRETSVVATVFCKGQGRCGHVTDDEWPSYIRGASAVCDFLLRAAGIDPDAGFPIASCIATPAEGAAFLASGDPVPPICAHCVAGAHHLCLACARRDVCGCIPCGTNGPPSRPAAIPGTRWCVGDVLWKDGYVITVTKADDSWVDYTYAKTGLSGAFRPDDASDYRRATDAEIAEAIATRALR